jgi:hypothetical protein
MVAAMAEAEQLRAAGDAYKRELLAAKLAEREGTLGAAQDALQQAKREAASALSFIFFSPPRSFSSSGGFLWGLLPA